MADLAPVFEALRALMAPYAAGLEVKADTSDTLYLDTRHRQSNGKPLFFGAVQAKKGFVSYHLMPVYVQPALLDGMSPALKARMQGKSCFNFKVIDPALLAELDGLTHAAYGSFREQGFVPPLP